jgi:hypothetical protein
VTSRLGPLPASAAIVIGLAGGVIHGVDRGYLIAAGGLFLFLIAFSAVYSFLLPYRIMLAKAVNADEYQPERYVTTTVDPSLRQERWLEERIRQEERIYGRLRTRQSFTLTLKPKDLQQAFDVERWVFVIVQVLFAAIIVELVAGLAFD